MKDEETSARTVRLPVSVESEVRVRAERHRRTFNAELVVMLEAHIQTEKQGEAA